MDRTKDYKCQMELTSIIFIRPSSFNLLQVVQGSVSSIPMYVRHRYNPSILKLNFTVAIFIFTTRLLHLCIYDS